LWLVFGLPAAWPRTWTDQRGRTLEADYAGYTNGKVALRLANGDVRELAIDLLSPADRRWVVIEAGIPRVPDPNATSNNDQPGAEPSGAAAGTVPGPHPDLLVFPRKVTRGDKFWLIPHPEKLAQFVSGDAPTDKPGEQETNQGEPTAFVERKPPTAGQTTPFRDRRSAYGQDTAGTEPKPDTGRKNVVVQFYRDTDGDGQLDTTTDLLLVTDEDGADDSSAEVSTSEFPLGKHTYFALIQPAGQSPEAAPEATSEELVLKGIGVVSGPIDALAQKPSEETAEPPPSESEPPPAEEPPPSESEPPPAEEPPPAAAEETGPPKPAGGPGRGPGPGGGPPPDNPYADGPRPGGPGPTEIVSSDPIGELPDELDLGPTSSDDILVGEDDPPDEVAAAIQRALGYIGDGDYARAITLYDDLLVDRPDDAIVLRERAAAYLADGRYDLAVRDYDRLIVRDANDFLFYYNRGCAHLAAGRLESALADFSMAIRLDGQGQLGSRAYNNRGIVHARLAAYDQALADFNQAIQVDQADALAYRNRGMTYQMLGKQDEASADLSRAAEMAP